MAFQAYFAEAVVTGEPVPLLLLGDSVEADCADETVLSVLRLFL